MKRTVSFSSNTKNIFFHILTKCNLQCRHCYINPEQHGDNTLPLSTIETWLGSLYGEGRKANLVFLGGEPTLHPQLPHAVKTARRMGYDSITIDTNGYLFHDILDKVTPEELDFFSFSLDGPTPQKNDALRGAGSFEACVAGIRRARDRGFHTSLIYTVSRRNLLDLEAMPALLTELAVDRFFIQIIGLRGRSGVSAQKGGPGSALQVSREEWLSAVPSVAERAAAAGIAVTYPRVYLEAAEPFECAGLTADNYFVFPNGRVYRCPLCEDFPLHSMVFDRGVLKMRAPVNETDLFGLAIPEGCVMNRLVQPQNLVYNDDGTPAYRIACCMLKEDIEAGKRGMSAS